MGKFSIRKLYYFRNYRLNSRQPLTKTGLSFLARNCWFCQLKRQLSLADFISCNWANISFMSRLHTLSPKKCNAPYSELRVFTCYSKVVSPSALLRLVVISDKQPKWAIFVVLAVHYQVKPDTNNVSYNAYKISWINCISVNIGFYFDVTTRGGVFAAILPTLCWHVCSFSPSVRYCQC